MCRGGFSVLRFRVRLFLGVVGGEQRAEGRDRKVVCGTWRRGEVIEQSIPRLQFPFEFLMVEGT